MAVPITNEGFVPECPYCNQPSKRATGVEIYPHRPDLYELKFWLCRPCDAYVGCHKRGSGWEPLGRLANRELRMWKSRAHRVFDPVWKDTRVTRQEAYAWLAGALDKFPEECHIGMFDVEDCQRVIAAVQKSFGPLRLP